MTSTINQWHLCCGIADKMLRLRRTCETMSAVKRSTSRMNEEQAKRFGEWLREQRQAAGLSTIELGDAIGTTSATISRFEQGAFSAPDPHKLQRIADALSLSLA